MRINLEVVGERQVGRRMTRIATRALDMRPAMSDVADVLINAEKRQFDSEDGWQRDALSTRRRKAREGLDPRTMRATGKLERVLTHRRARGQLLEITRDSVTFGLKGGRSDGYYGRFHQDGDGVPKRPVVPHPSQRTIRAVAQVIQRNLTS